MEPRLAVVSGASKGTIARLNNVEMTISRDPDNGLCLNEDAVSRKHCTIKSDSGIYRILDLNSRHGTFVNSIPVREKILQHLSRSGEMVKSTSSCAGPKVPWKPSQTSVGVTLSMQPSGDIHL